MIDIFWLPWWALEMISSYMSLLKELLAIHSDVFDITTLDSIYKDLPYESSSLCLGPFLGCLPSQLCNIKLHPFSYMLDPSHGQSGSLALDLLQIGWLDLSASHYVNVEACTTCWQIICSPVKRDIRSFRLV